jgi:hypothetical protein
VSRYGTWYRSCEVAKATNVRTCSLTYSLTYSRTLPTYSCEAARAGELCEGSGECATDQAADNCGGFDVYVVHYLLPTTKWLQVRSE